MYKLLKDQRGTTATPVLIFCIILLVVSSIGLFRVAHDAVESTNIYYSNFNAVDVSDIKTNIEGSIVKSLVIEGTTMPDVISIKPLSSLPDEGYNEGMINGGILLSLSGEYLGGDFTLYADEEGNIDNSKLLIKDIKELEGKNLIPYFLDNTHVTLYYKGGYDDFVRDFSNN